MSDNKESKQTAANKEGKDKAAQSKSGKDSLPEELVRHHQGIMVLERRRSTT